MFRKSSLGNDETDKEKKKFLGFFKANKRSNSKVSHTQVTLWGVKDFLTVFLLHCLGIFKNNCIC
jgi:hypothetical protein